MVAQLLSGYRDRSVRQSQCPGTALGLLRLRAMKHRGCPENRMAREWQFLLHGEDPGSRAGRTDAREEDGLELLHLSGQALHHRMRPAVGIEKHRQSVSGKRGGCEDIDMKKRRVEHDDLLWV